MDNKKIDVGHNLGDGCAVLCRFQDDREDDVVFLYEERLATREQVARARELMLPDNFYLYESRAPCPGCIGCEESFEPVHHSLTAGNWISESFVILCCVCWLWCSTVVHVCLSLCVCPSVLRCMLNL